MKPIFKKPQEVKEGDIIISGHDANYSPYYKKGDELLVLPKHDIHNDVFPVILWWKIKDGTIEKKKLKFLSTTYRYLSNENIQVVGYKPNIASKINASIYRHEGLYNAKKDAGINIEDIKKLPIYQEIIKFGGKDVTGKRQASRGALKIGFPTYKFKLKPGYNDLKFPKGVAVYFYIITSNGNLARGKSDSIDAIKGTTIYDLGHVLTTDNDYSILLQQILIDIKNLVSKYKKTN